jgi:NAD(P)-dependent dehydrogenase (short-subunit alcohol dehydrogenase family)
MGLSDIARGSLRTGVTIANRLGATPVGLSGRQHLLTAGARIDSSTPSSALQHAVAGKVVMITGASSGIGRSTALLLGAAGAHVLLVARSADELDRVQTAIAEGGGTATAYRCDLTDYDELDALVAKVLDQHGHLDVLVNNAGHSIRRKVAHSVDRFHDFERPMQLNYFAAIRLIMGFLPTMREREIGQIINISTWAVQLRPARFSGYTASKAALEVWSDCVQGEVLNEGIVFTTIRMPLVRTPMIAPTKIYRRVPALTPEQAAQTVGDAIVCRPRRLRPAFGHLIALTEALSPRATDRVRNRAL